LPAARGYASAGFKKGRDCCDDIGGSLMVGVIYWFVYLRKQDPALSD